MIGVVLVVVVAGYLLACVAAGFGPAGSFSEFEPTNARLTHRYRQPVDQVIAAYGAAVAATPGMRVAQTDYRQMLVDMRPTSRVLGGNFGLVIHLRFQPDGDGTRVDTASRNKVAFALSNHQAALEHAERAMRARAKSAGLHEILRGIG